MLNRLKNYVAIFCFFETFCCGIASEIYDDCPILEDIAVALVRTRRLLDAHQSYVDSMNIRFCTEEEEQAKRTVIIQTFGKIVHIYMDRLMKYDFSEIDLKHPLFCGTIYEVFLNRNNDNHHYKETMIDDLNVSSKIQPLYLLDTISVYIK